jgi:hypothetical protein
MLTLQKRRRKRPSHPRRVLLPTRIYLAGFMTRGLPLRKRDYAHRHDSARASLRNVDCLHKAMRARAQRGARRKGLGFFFSCYTRLPPCNVITGDLGRGAAALGRRGGWRKEIPSQGDGRCGGVVVVRESVHSVQVGCLGHGLQLTTLLARERGGEGERETTCRCHTYLSKSCVLTTVYLETAQLSTSSTYPSAALPRDLFLFYYIFAFRAQPRERVWAVPDPTWRRAGVAW